MANLKCITCDKNLISGRTKFCSIRCNKLNNLKKLRAISTENFSLKSKVKCSCCDKILPRGKRKHCSSECRKKFRQTIDTGKGSHKFRNEKAKETKINLIKILGGSCESCGYSKNYAALSFHHKDPKTKKFSIIASARVDRSWEDILQEALKCSLLCHTCHQELHNPQCLISNEQSKNLYAFCYPC